MLKEMLEARKIPQLQSRKMMLDVLAKEVYGAIPPKPEKLTFTVRENVISNFCAGDARCHEVTANMLVNGKPFSFPFHATIPTEGGQHPFFVMLNFRPDVPDRYQPTEEIVNHGFAVLSLCYQDVTSDDGDFTKGLAGVLYPDGQRGETDPGKIALWAWAAQRVMDYAETLGSVLDLSRAAVCGHSRLGKTALYAAATDDRFAFAYSNDSGCAGAALARHNTGETVEAICRRFPYWFCQRYHQYRNNETAMPFDQHYLLASIAPRKVLVGSTSGDAWADPTSEYLCCMAAAPAFPNGFVHEDRLPQIGEAFVQGDVGYHLRKGLHYFSRKDWLRLIEFVQLHS